MIEGLDAAAAVEGVEIFHAGTRADGGRILANGGRVLNVSALGKTVAEAQARAYAAVDRIHWPDGFCRRDIGWRAVERERGGAERHARSRRPLSRLRLALDRRPRPAGSSRAPAGRGRRSCCCTAIRRPMSCGTGWRRRWREHFSLVIPDLPGYGWSDAPHADAEHAPYTKRAMANAMIEVMEALGHARFRLAGHDRGGRVAYRLALDHPGPARASSPCSTSCRPGRCGTDMDARLANRAWHWTFLALPAPFPETLIGKDPVVLFRYARRGRHQDQEPRGLRSARARALPRLLQRSAAHSRDLRGLPRRPHHRSRPRRG